MQFSFNRFILLLRKQLSENGRLYMMGIAALAGFWIMFLLIFLSQGAGIQAQIAICSIGLLLGGVLFAYQQFQALAGVPQSIRYLHLPASQTEKIIAAFTLTCLIFLPAMIALFYAVEIPIVQAIRARYANRPDILAQVIVMPVKEWSTPLQLFFMSASFFAFGTVYFRRSALIKTTLSFFALLMVAQLLNMQFTQWIIPSPEGTNFNISGGLFDDIFLYSEKTGESDHIRMPAVWKQLLGSFVMYGVPVLCWVFAWFRLRETEVV